MPIQIKTFFDSDTATFTHVVSDVATQSAAIIDPVLNYDQYSGRTSTNSADEVIAYIHQHSLRVEWILDTHIHADHLTGSSYLKTKVGGIIGIGARIQEVLALWVPLFNTSSDTPLDGSQFDKLLADNEILKLGNVDIRVIYTPGHTPACVSYMIEDAVFVGDTLLMPDVGTARTDFPGGSAEVMYDSVQRLLSLHPSTRLFMCHDYPPTSRETQYQVTVKEQQQHNILLNAATPKAQYVTARNQRDKGKAVPKLLLPSLQVNLRAGSLGAPEANHTHYIKIPLNRI